MQTGESPLYSASSGGHQKVVELLTRAGANVSVQKEVKALMYFSIVSLLTLYRMDPVHYM